MTIAQLYLIDLIAWGKVHGWTYNSGVFTSANGVNKSLPEFYKLWLANK